MTETTSFVIQIGVPWEPFWHDYGTYRQQSRALQQIALERVTLPADTFRLIKRILTDEMLEA